MFNSEELNKIEYAILQLTLGEKIVSFSRSSAAGSQTVTFNQTQIGDLERLRAQIKRQLNQGKSDYLKVSSSKGL